MDTRQTRLSVSRPQAVTYNHTWARPVEACTRERGLMLLFILLTFPFDSGDSVGLELMPLNPANRLRPRTLTKQPWKLVSEASHDKY